MDQINELKSTLQTLHENEISEHEYEHIYGIFWLLTDSLMRLNRGNEFLVKTKDETFRRVHMEVKNFLFSQPEDCAELSRGNTFPNYTRYLQK